MKTVNKILVLSFAVLFFSCGYGFKGNNPPEGVKTIAVPLFNDNSGYALPDIKEKFTEQMKNKIIGDNTLILTDRTKADAMLTCTISSIRDEALVISGNENVSKRKIIISLNVVFENLKKEKKIWERTYENWGEYSSSDNSFSEREVGLSFARNKITDDILNDIISNW